MSERASRVRPWISTILLCDRILEEKDGTLSAIRIIDQVRGATIEIEQRAGAQVLRGVPLDVNLLIIARSGRAVGSYKLEMRIVHPGGSLTKGSTVETAFDEREESGRNLILPVQALLTEEGVYWFETRFLGGSWTRTPLKVVFDQSEGAED